MTEMLNLSLPAISQEGPQQLRAAPGDLRVRGAPCPSSRRLGTADGFASGSLAAVGLGSTTGPAGSGRVALAALSLRAGAWQQDSAARLHGALNPARGTVSRQPAVS